MNFPNVEAFDSSWAPHDHCEAILIDRALEHNTELDLESAIREVYTDLSDPSSKALGQFPELLVRGADKYGYQTAKMAKQWWKFRQAYLFDLQEEYMLHPEGRPFDTRSDEFELDPDHDTFESQLEELFRQHDAAGENLYKAEFDEMVLLYSGLEKYRMARRIANEPITEPLVEEHRFAYRALLLALDDRFNQEQTVSLDDRHKFFIEHYVLFDNFIADVSVSREQRTSFSRYSIRQTPWTGINADKSQVEEADYLPAKQYTIKQYNGSESITVDRSFGKLNPGPLTTGEAMRIVAGISKNSDQVIQKVLEST